jgi:diguanylate cyclase (GGDEF)-like protein/PAS domain S-box-containing protein
MPPGTPSIAPHVSLATIMDLLLDAVCVVDAEGRYLFVSAGYERIFGYRPDEVVGTRMIDKVHPDDRERTLRAAQNIMAGHAQPHFQNRYVHKDGHVIDVQWSARWSEEEGVRIAVGHDITELKRAESMQGALLAISEAAHADVDLSTLFGHIHRVVDGLLPATNFFVALRNPADGSVEFPYFIDEHDPAPAPMSLTAPTLTNAVIRSGRALLITPDNTPDLPADLQQVIGHASVDWLGVPLSVATGVIGALVVQSYTGNVRYSSADMQLLEYVSTQVASAVERNRDRSMLAHMVGHDSLTDLPNRYLFDEKLAAAMLSAADGQLSLGLLYMDLDGFKQVNDRHGHASGDLMLQQAAHRIRRCVRQSDTVARLGGDEFVALLYGVTDVDQATAVAEKIRRSLELPFELDGTIVQITASIGIAHYPDDGQDKQSLLHHADNAMYAAKRQGGNRLACSGDVPDGGASEQYAA